MHAGDMHHQQALSKHGAASYGRPGRAMLEGMGGAAGGLPSGGLGIRPRAHNMPTGPNGHTTTMPSPRPLGVDSGEHAALAATTTQLRGDPPPRQGAAAG